MAAAHELRSSDEKKKKKRKQTVEDTVVPETRGIDESNAQRNGGSDVVAIVNELKEEKSKKKKKGKQTLENSVGAEQSGKGEERDAEVKTQSAAAAGINGSKNVAAVVDELKEGKPEKKKKKKKQTMEDTVVTDTLGIAERNGGTDELKEEKPKRKKKSKKTGEDSVVPEQPEKEGKSDVDVKAESGSKTETNGSTDLIAVMEDPKDSKLKKKKKSKQALEEVVVPEQAGKGEKSDADVKAESASKPEKNGCTDVVAVIDDSKDLKPKKKKKSKPPVEEVVVPEQSGKAEEKLDSEVQTESTAVAEDDSKDLKSKKKGKKSKQSLEEVVVPEQSGKEEEKKTDFEVQTESIAVAEDDSKDLKPKKKKKKKSKQALEDVLVPEQSGKEEKIDSEKQAECTPIQTESAATAEGDAVMDDLKDERSNKEKKTKQTAEEVVVPDTSNQSPMDIALPETPKQTGKKRRRDDEAVTENIVVAESEAKATTASNAGAREDDGDFPVKNAKRQKVAAYQGTPKFFQKIDINEVKYADPRLQDNSYWAKDGAEEGWGAKAQQVLGQVRGKGFRHEKTKKKRGSYKGGAITFATHSIKFKDSDDDE